MPSMSQLLSPKLSKRMWDQFNLSSILACVSFSHHYQGRIDFNTVNLFHSTGMDLAGIPASRVGLTNPVPRDRIS